MTDELETFAARLASFDLVLHSEKRRTSSAKALKPIAWPHRRPSPAELAHAGFYYNPYETNPDNTTCFLCQRALDGWEEEDNPITEHLKHAPDCGWAVMMDIQQHSSNPAEIEDPTSDKIREARVATFGASWPHDGKRGWVCQSEKMVDGGWYFCPTEESNDLASCAYCKLSLDGWEPKDDPFDEHYRRSADCSFFVFAQPAGKKAKASRAKKPRTSKVSRLSTQSTASEIVPEFGDQIDQPTEPQPMTKSKTTKKTSKAKSKKSKKDEVPETDNQMDIDPADSSQPEPAKTKRATRGKKRTSDQVERDPVPVLDIEQHEGSEPPTKKRATKTRNSIQAFNTQSDAVVHVQTEENAAEEEPKKGRGGTKKKTTKGRKVSAASSSSKPASEPQVADDNDLYAALVAELEGSEPREPSAEPPQQPKKSKSKKKQKAESPQPDEADEHIPEMKAQPNVELEIQPEPEPTPEIATKKVKPSRKSRSSNVSEPSTEPPTKAREQLETSHPRGEEIKRQNSSISVEIKTRAPQKEPQAEPGDKGADEMAKQRSSGGKAKKQKKSTSPVVENAEPAELEVETIESPGGLPADQDEDDVPEHEAPSEPASEAQEQAVEPQQKRRRSSKVPPKTAERYSDIPEEKQFARTLVGPRSSGHRSSGSASQQQENVSPLPTSRGTPSLSPQASDAENQPPSLRPSASRPPLASPSKHVRIPFEASTPSPSKRIANSGGLHTVQPWNPIDIDEILLAGNSDKENVDLSLALNNAKADLTSPEKQMTVEEWIKWHAKNGEEKLRQECERLVGQFEKEGARAMRVLEGIECTD
ncbi:hypothetical protein BDV25DRAFT_10004 [Aspergillus avenaceus]|uniref:Chromosome segregation protein BIR1 n=1 Tax=Aspergillus avenaceus TaxID=36643 RepID=A0A5N6U5S3_ASPAV|nr:hypothetical protein BDV25DRAFT_10004 [Aspergillus avenaceus]